MVNFIVNGDEYCLKLRNDLNNDLPYDISEIDSTVAPGVLAPQTSVELRFRPSSVPIIDPCLKLMTLMYSYGRPVFVEFGKDNTIQTIDLTEMPGFTMIENTNEVDHIYEYGHHVKLYGDSTTNICVDVWYKEN